MTRARSAPSPLFPELTAGQRRQPESKLMVCPDCLGAGDHRDEPPAPTALHTDLFIIECSACDGTGRVNTTS